MPAAELGELAERASQLFAGSVTLEETVDPEYPTTAYVVVRVVLDAPRPSTDEIIERELRWHREAARIAPNAKGMVRLFVE